MRQFYEQVRVDAEYIDSFRAKLRWAFLSFDLYPTKPKEKKPKEEKPKQEEPPAPEEPKPKKPNPFKTFYENQGYEGVKQLIRDTADALGSLMKSIKKHLILDELFLFVVVSHNHDAARTAIEYGEACREIFPAMGFICSNLKVKKYDVEVFPSELLGSQNEMVQLTQTGAIDFCVASNSLLETFSDNYTLFNLPYLFASSEAYHAGRGKDLYDKDQQPSGKDSV